MVFRDSQLFPDSLWSNETNSVVLRRVSEPFSPPFSATTTTRTPVSEPGDPGSASRFSLSSDDPPSSESSNGVLPQLGRSLRRARLSPIPRSYTSFGRHSRRRVSSRTSAGLQAIDEMDWPIPPRTKPTLQQSVHAPNGPEVPDNDMPRARAFLFVVVICMAQLSAQAGIGQTLAIIRIIGSRFGISNTSDLTWVLAGYCLAVGTFILIAGRLGDAYGYKRIFLIGFLWSAAWAAISGAAFYSTHVLFIITRVFQGLGVALCLPNGLALLGTAYPPGKRKAMVFTLFAVMSPTGILVGAAGAGALSLVWWPLTYWAFSVVLFVIAVIGRFVIPNPTWDNKAPVSIRAFMTELDIPGAFAGVSSLALISFAWNQGPFDDWKQPYVWVSLILGLVLVGIFVLIECYYAPKPLIPFMALSSDVALVLVSVACGWSCFGIWASYTWQFALNIRGASPLLTTAYFSPIIFVGLFSAGTTGFMLHRLGPSIGLFISLIGFTVGSLLIATAPVVQSYWSQLFICILMTSWSMDMTFPAATFVLSHVVDRKHQGTAASLVSTVMYYSISLGLGIARTVECSVNRGGLTRRNRLRGYRGALFTGVGLAAIGSLVCLAFMIKAYRRKQKRRCNCHGMMEEHNQI